MNAIMWTQVWTIFRWVTVRPKRQDRWGVLSQWRRALLERSGSNGSGRSEMLANLKALFKQMKNPSYWKQRVSNAATHWVYAVSRVWAGLKSTKVALRSFNTSFKTKLRFFGRYLLCAPSCISFWRSGWVAQFPCSPLCKPPQTWADKQMSKSESIDKRKQQWAKLKKNSTLYYLLSDCILASTFMLWSNLTTHNIVGCSY